MEDRRQQYDLVNKLAAALNHMSWAVDSIIGARDAANARAAQLGPNDSLRQRLSQFAAAADTARGKIVATKEGGAITGEERLREFLGTVYGDVNGYDGRPTQEEVQRTDVLARELEDVVREFTTLSNQQLASINRDLARKKLQPIRVISEQEWQKANQQQEAGGAPAAGLQAMRERD